MVFTGERYGSRSADHPLSPGSEQVSSSARMVVIMNKPLISLASVARAAALGLTGCSSSDSSDSSNADSNAGSSGAPAAEATPEAAAAPDLAGTWKQTNSGSDDAYQAAVITADTITINWVSDGGDTESIYWVGTFKAPTDDASPYTWASARDAAATDVAMLASTDDSKEFTYEDGEVSYKASIMGTTTTVRLEKE